MSKNTSRFGLKWTDEYRQSLQVEKVCEHEGCSEKFLCLKQHAKISKYCLEHKKS